MTPPSLPRRGCRLRRFSPIALTAAVIAALAPGAAAAAAGPAVIVKVHRASAVVSPYFQLGGRPGGISRAGSLELVNPTGQAVTVRLDPVDAMTTSTLGSAYRLAGGRAHGAARWIAVSQRQVVIPANGDASVSVAVNVPRAAGAGDYLAGVSVEALGQDQVTSSHGVAIGQIERYAIGVEVSLPGRRRPAIALTGAAVHRDPSGLVFQVFGHNRSNAILQNVHGRIVVKRGSKTVGSTPVGPGTFVSGTAIAYPVRAPREQPSEGTRYSVHAEFDYPGGVARLDRTVVFGHAGAVAQEHYGGPQASAGGGLPAWIWISVALAALALAGAAFVRARRRVPVEHTDALALGRAGALAFLREEIASRPAGRPLSVVGLGVDGAGLPTRRQLADAIEPKLRRTDRIFDLESDGLLIVLPDTTALLAEEFALDSVTAAARADLAGVVRAVNTATAKRDGDPEELIDRATAAPPVVPAPA